MKLDNYPLLPYCVALYPLTSGIIIITVLFSASQVITMVNIGFMSFFVVHFLFTELFRHHWKFSEDCYMEVIATLVLFTLFRSLLYTTPGIFLDLYQQNLIQASLEVGGHAGGLCSVLEMCIRYRRGTIFSKDGDIENDIVIKK